jgi:hypothetical protein
VEILRCASPATVIANTPFGQSHCLFAAAVVGAALRRGPVAFSAAHWEADEVRVQTHRHALGALADPILPMPRRRSHASKGMMVAARILGNTGACVGARPSIFSARAVNKTIALRSGGRALEIVIRRKSLASIQPRRSAMPLERGGNPTQLFPAVSFRARDFAAPTMALRRCGLHQHDEESSHWQRPSPGECPP